MPIDRGLRAKLRYRSDQFLSGGAGKQLLFLFALSMTIVLLHVAISRIIVPVGVPHGFVERFWFYFTRILDAGTMGGDEGSVTRVLSTFDTILGVIVAGLLISSLAGNFQQRLEDIKSSGSPVVESGHFLVLGWSEKIYSVIDQISEAYVAEGRITVVVMAEGDKPEMEEKLAEKLQHLDRMRIVVRSGTSLSLNDLSRVSFQYARAIIVLINDEQRDDASAADGRIVKSLLALYNHPDTKGQTPSFRVTAEIMLAESTPIALIASGGRAQVVKTNEIISKIILQTSRISGLSLVYDELLRFEGNEIHFKAVPAAVGKRFGDVVLDFPNACLVGLAMADGSGHTLNPPSDRVIQANEVLLLLAEDAKIVHAPYEGPEKNRQVQVPATRPEKPAEELLVLGWNEKIFPIISEFDNYVGGGSRLTLVNTVPKAEREARVLEACAELTRVKLEHVEGDFTNQHVMESIGPQRFRKVMVLGDSGSDGEANAEEADTRAIIALLLLRDARRRAGTGHQDVCTEILEPKNRELAATTEINDIVISNEMVSMVLAQVTYEPRVRAVIEDLFTSEGSEIYLKDLALYAPPGEPVTFEYLLRAARSRGELALGLQIYVPDPEQRFGMLLNPRGERRSTAFTPKPGDRLVVLAEDDG